ncbi:MAG: hypothetical protein QNI96_10465 [Woeseiaceae bacterium]|nr:hypothetical protein [Woeseiaceae bacterium]
MTKRLIIAFATYSVWFCFNIAVAIVPIGDGGVAAHLRLTITGFPSSLASWLLPHGSIQGVLVAGLLGTVQLLALVAFVTYRRN